MHVLYNIGKKNCLFYPTKVAKDNEFNLAALLG